MPDYHDGEHSSLQRCERSLWDECDCPVRNVGIPKADRLLGHLGVMFAHKSPFGIYVQAIQMAVIIS